MTVRLGVDVGGTFTDLIYVDADSGDLRVSKVPTQAQAPEAGILDAINVTIPDGSLSDCEYLVHGTTVGLNALLERQGAAVGLLCTDGFRDILEIGRGDRADPYDLFWEPPPSLVPRRLRFAIRERIRASGAVDREFCDADVLVALERFEDEGIRSVAVAFINAYVNPAHELRAATLLRENGFEGEISLSHQISGEHREYERTCTTVIDAYVRPVVSSYLSRLELQLGRQAFRGTPLVTRSGGGAMSFGEAEQRPVDTILSGPAAGAEGAAELARLLDLGDVITADVGGTSFDTCLITGGRPTLMYEGSVVGLPVQTPWIDVRSIGAGGGSIARVDVGGLLKVGPHSAGAQPGPASYGRGGTEPTVTDAAFVLGMLGEGQLAGGLQLDVDSARAAIASVAEPLELSVEEAARGILTVATASMSDAIREITVEQGQDPRTACLVPFGGAGPLFGTLLADELEIDRIVVPPHAGNFSAWGLLGADIVRAVSKTRILPLVEANLVDATNLVSELYRELDRQANGLADESERIYSAALDIRYVGQEHSLTIDVSSPNGTIEMSEREIHGTFSREYERAYAHVMDEQLEIVAVRAAARTPLPRGRLVEKVPSGRRAAGTIEAYSFNRREWLLFALIDRVDLDVGSTIGGPAIIREDTAVTYVDADYTVTLAKDGSMKINRQGALAHD